MGEPPVWKVRHLIALPRHLYSEIALLLLSNLLERRSGIPFLADLDLAGARVGSRTQGWVKVDSTGRVLWSPNTVPATVNPSEGFVASIFHAIKRSLNKRD